MISNILSNSFLLTALIASFLASIASAITGSFIVIKRISSISGSIAHSVLGGIGLFIYLKYTFNISWLNPSFGAFLAGILASIVIGHIHLNYKQREDALLATIWSFGMAIGVIFLSLTPSYKGEITNFLFGNLLWVSKSHLLFLLVFTLLIILITSYYYNRFLAICFDEEGAYLQGLRVKYLYFLLLGLISIAIVILINIIGIILVICLLTIPPTIAKKFTNNFFKIICLSCVFAIFFNFSGIFISYFLNWPPGATIAIVTTCFYMFSLLKKN